MNDINIKELVNSEIIEMEEEKSISNINNSKNNLDKKRNLSINNYIENSKTVKEELQEQAEKEVHLDIDIKNLELEDKNLNHEYDKFKFQVKKKLLMKYAKSEAKAMKKQKQIEILQQKWGYLYKCEENYKGVDINNMPIIEKVYIDFVPSNFVNHIKAISNFLQSISKSQWKIFGWFVGTIILLIIIGLSIWGVIELVNFINSVQNLI